MKNFDLVVLGAGIVGICTALHIQRRGLSVLLVDRHQYGRETSFGNAGIVQREGVFPYAFPRSFFQLLEYSFNTAIAVRYHASTLPKIAPFLWQYWRASAPRNYSRIAQQYAKLIERCVAEHELLIAESGCDHLIRRTGWIKLFRTQKALDASAAEAKLWRDEYGVESEVLDTKRLLRCGPHLLISELPGGMHFTQPIWTTDPYELVSCYFELFNSLGGELMHGDAMSLETSTIG